MTRTESVLVGVDGSAPSLHALDWAAAYALQVGWPLHIVCTYSLPSFTAASLDGGYAALDDSAIQEGARASLLENRARALLDGRVVERRIAAVERGRRERRQGVGADDVERPAHLERVRRGPVQGVQARCRAVDADEDGFRAGHERLSSRRPGAIGRPT